ncbi:MAG: hypothetical protein ACE5LA_06910 [Dehalococcoidales bacterium]
MKPELSEMSELEAEPLNGENFSRVEPDLPPEYCHYRDEGCDLADSCLDCPFPQCIYEQPRGRQRWLKKLRDKEIARLFNSEGKGVKELASMFAVSQRTVQRALRNPGNKGDLPRNE